MKKRLVVLSGAGVSAESGISTFRDAGGLWEGHDIMEVASPEGWRLNRELVLKFYNDRRRELKKVQPNRAHRILGPGMRPATTIRSDFRPGSSEAGYAWSP